MKLKYLIKYQNDKAAQEHRGLKKMDKRNELNIDAQVSATHTKSRITSKTKSDSLP